MDTFRLGDFASLDNVHPYDPSACPADERYW